MIITCPHCSTRYQVAHEAIGAAGRKVQCAACHRNWQERPHEAEEVEEDDTLFENISEDGLDEAILAEERAVAARIGARLAVERAVSEAAAMPVREAPPADPTTMRKRQRAFSKRRQLLQRDLPMARMRRIARWSVLAVLAGILAGLYFGRVAVVTQLPALAGLYEALGMPVNVLGLEFSGIRTQRGQADGRQVLSVSADIVGLAPRPVVVPPVLVALTDARGETIYQWSVTPSVHTLIAGESVAIETQLAAPPAAAVGVRLSFGGSRGGAASPDPQRNAGAP